MDQEIPAVNSMVRSLFSDAARLAEMEAVLFRPMGADGVRARTGRYEAVVEALAALISRRRPQEAEVFRFPPVMSRSHLEAGGYLKSFPNLLGCVCCLDGSEQEVRAAASRLIEGEPWTDALTVADLVLTPASCYPIYPIAAAQGPVTAAGRTYDVGCDCFRREPSRDLDRMQSFRMREFVRIGAPEQIWAFRDAWMDKARDLAEELGLSYSVEIANDPFFGRGSQLMAAIQREKNLKFELLVPVISEAKPTACMSFNDHQDHFGTAWGVALEDGRPAHTGCVAFGMDRLALALFARHGLEVAGWPQTVRAVLGV
jgi:seryl-tRNA synthetase